MMFVSVCLTSRGIIISGSIHVAANGIIFFFVWLSSILMCVYKYTHTHRYIHIPHHLCPSVDGC